MCYLYVSAFSICRSTSDEDTKLYQPITLSTNKEVYNERMCKGTLLKSELQHLSVRLYLFYCLRRTYFVSQLNSLFLFDVICNTLASHDERSQWKGLDGYIYCHPVTVHAYLNSTQTIFVYLTIYAAVNERILSAIPVLNSSTDFDTSLVDVVLQTYV